MGSNIMADLLGTIWQAVFGSASAIWQLFLTGGIFSPVTSTPEYIDRGSEQAWPQPNDLQRTNLYGFILEGSLPALQELCDRYLNVISPDTGRYRPLTHYVILTFGDNPRVGSVDLPYSDRGFVGYQEAILWVLAAKGQQWGPLFMIERLAAFPAYIFANDSLAIAGGREIFGFPKQWGWFNFPKEKGNSPYFTLEALAWKEFAPEAEAMRSRLIEVSVGNKGKDKIWRGMREAIEDIVELLFAGKGKEIVIPGWSLPFNLLYYLLEERMPLVFLKQFRDVTDGNKACYQAVVEAPTEVVKFHQGCLLGDRYRVKVADFASHPMARDLGLGDREQIAKLAFCLNFDFTIENGREIWQAKE